MAESKRITVPGDHNIIYIGDNITVNINHGSSGTGKNCVRALVYSIFFYTFVKKIMVCRVNNTCLNTPPDWTLGNRIYCRSTNSI